MVVLLHTDKEHRIMEQETVECKYEIVPGGKPMLRMTIEVSICQGYQTAKFGFSADFQREGDLKEQVQMCATEVRQALQGAKSQINIIQRSVGHTHMWGE